MGENGEFKGYAKASIESLKERFEEIQAQLNRRFNDMEKEVNEIKENHLVHLAGDIELLKGKGDRNTWLVITTLVGIAITLALELLKRT